MNRKKSAFNLALIESVRQKSELYDCRQRQTDEKQCESWEQVAKEVGVTCNFFDKLKMFILLLKYSRKKYDLLIKKILKSLFAKISYCNFI